MSEEQKKSGIGGIGDGIRTGIGILSALKDALEDTLEEAVKRGDLSPDRARVAMKDAADRIQGSMEGAKERFDLVSRKDFDELAAQLTLLRDRVSRLEGRTGLTPPPEQERPGIIITE